jgi:hypothetical protein
MNRSLYPQPDDPEDSNPSGGDSNLGSDEFTSALPNHNASATPQDIRDPDESALKEPRLIDSLESSHAVPTLRTPPDLLPSNSDWDRGSPESPLESPPTYQLPSVEDEITKLQEPEPSSLDNTTESAGIGIQDGPISTVVPEASMPDTEVALQETNTEVISPPEAPEEASHLPPVQPNTESDDTHKENPKPGSAKHSTFSFFGKKHATTLWLFLPLLFAVLGGFILSAIYPDVISLISRAVVAIIIVIFVVFIVLGVLVVIGLREQARSLLSLLFEGGVRYINFAQTLSEIWETIIKIAQEFILLISPFLAVFLAAIFYYIVMFSFRAVGANTDITIFTIIMTIVLGTVTMGLGQIKISDTEDPKSFKTQFSLRFSRVFIDSIEIVVLLVFLTIDAERLFFLPPSLQTPLKAELFGIDFMARGISGAGFNATLRIAGAAVFVEVIRKVYRLVMSIYIRYKEMRIAVETDGREFSSQGEAFDTLRKAARIAFKDNLDDFMKFLGFTTILVVAFFFFPRLKLLSLLFFNITNLAWDLIIPSRATRKARSEDLLSRTIAKVFKL